MSIIIDTREPFEYAQSHVEGAINLPASVMASGRIPDQLANVEKDEELILYCRTGARSNTAGYILREHGFTNIVNGINEQQVNKLLANR